MFKMNGVAVSQMIKPMLSEKLIVTILGKKK